MEVEILLVEDDPNDLELTLRALRKKNVANRIEVAQDGAAALDFIFCQGTFSSRSIQDQPRLIMLDLKLPKIDGLEVLQKIKSDPRTRAIPVVVLTSSAEERDIVRSYELGVNSFITKPVDFQQFTDAIGQLGMYWMLLNKAS
jgi:CheY-like chemotaxis protein